MLLAEELVLLLVPKAVSATPRSGGTHTAVAGAVLIELADAGQLELTDDWVNVLPGDGHPLAPDLAEGTFDEVVRALVPGLYRTVLDRLADQAVLTKKRSIGGPRWRLADRDRRDTLLTELNEVLVNDVEPTYRTGALITLLHEMGALRPVFRATGPILRADTVANGAWATSPATAAMVAAVMDRLRYPPGDFQVGSASLG